MRKYRRLGVEIVIGGDWCHHHRSGAAVGAIGTCTPRHNQENKETYKYIDGECGNNLQRDNHNNLRVHFQSTALVIGKERRAE